jgi:hypothetical protein
MTSDKTAEYPSGNAGGLAWEQLKAKYKINTTAKKVELKRKIGSG